MMQSEKSFIPYPDEPPVHFPPAAVWRVLSKGLAEDPDVLDPTLARTFVGRIVFAGLCDKLFDLDEKLAIVPQLATSYQWSPDYKSLTLKIRQGVTFHDGEKLDAEAVKYNIDRHKTMQGSNRRGELAPVTGVEVVDAATVRLNLSAPFAPRICTTTVARRCSSWPATAYARGGRRIRPSTRTCSTAMSSNSTRSQAGRPSTRGFRWGRVCVAPRWWRNAIKTSGT